VPRISAVRRVQLVNGFLEEVADWQHQPPVVPDLHHHVGERDLLDPPPLVFHHHHVVQPDRLGDGDLEAGNQVAQRALRGKADDQAGDTGGGEQAPAELLEAVELQENRAAGEDPDDEGHHLAQDAELGVDLARTQVVRDIHLHAPEQRVLEHAHQPHQQQPEAEDQQAGQQRPQPGLVGSPPGDGQREVDAERRQEPGQHPRAAVFQRIGQLGIAAPQRQAQHKAGDEHGRDTDREAEAQDHQTLGPGPRAGPQRRENIGRIIHQPDQSLTNPGGGLAPNPGLVPVPPSRPPHSAPSVDKQNGSLAAAVSSKPGGRYWD
jgi:hypothetical protein